MADRPLVSVIIEGYNESLDLGSADETLAALARQEFPLDRVEVIVVGSEDQRQAWEARSPARAGFASTKFIAVKGAHYYELKNCGARVASGEILAFLDSDTLPERRWLAALVAAIEAGSDVTAGITTFRSEDGEHRWDALRAVAASISWGFVVGERDDSGGRVARSFLSHNVGFRAEVFRSHRYRTDLGRTCAGYFLDRSLRRSGATISLVPEQRVAHNFTLRWWLTRLHVRFGYEVFQLRRLSDDYPQGGIRRLPFAEPFFTVAWHLALDLPRWFRFSSLLPLSPARRVAFLPLVAVASFAARSAEMVGMLWTLAFPERMRRFAERN